jgi:energy-coupling factor transport system ATP-binding protein
MSLQLRAARYAYPATSRAVLDGIDLDVPSGRVVAVVGANDAGKSTLCLVAAGLAPRSIGGKLDGSVLLDRAESVSLEPHEAAQRCGILFQNALTQLSGTAPTVFEEVAFGPRNLGLDVSAIVERVESALEALGIGHLAPRDPLRLSGGQAQLVALASVLALRPAALALDEPTSQLDPSGTRLVGDALARLAAEAGTAILLVEHKPALIARLAHEVVVMDAGRIAVRGTPADVFGDPELEAFGVEPPAAVTLAGHAAAAGVGQQLAGLDLAALELAPPPADSTDAAAHEVEQPPVRRTAGVRAAPAIACINVGFVYPDGTRALDGVNLEIASGQRVAIVGQNGSGKSTLVRQFNGLLRPTEGAVTILGEAVGQRHVADLARQVGLAFQNPDRQIFAGRAGQEVAFGARNLGRRGVALDEAVERALEAVGLTGHEATNPYDLGYSKRKLLSLASILSMGTPILVLDEPTTGQDQAGVRRVREIVRSQAAEGRTVVAITHDLAFAASAFERIVVLRGGRIVLDGTPAEVFEEEQWATLASTFLEPTLAARVGARLGLGSTPTVEDVVAALSSRPVSAEPA